MYYQQWQVCLRQLQQPRKHRGFLYNSSFKNKCISHAEKVFFLWFPAGQISSWCYTERQANKTLLRWNKPESSGNYDEFYLYCPFAWHHCRELHAAASRKHVLEGMLLLPQHQKGNRALISGRLCYKVHSYHCFCMRKQESLCLVVRPWKAAPAN